MRSSKVQFTNEQGLNLSARLEMPVNQHPHSYAIFAHCFTCSKNLNAVRNISRCLTISGFAVLRFDFTGLGESEGHFESTNFSSNIKDIVAAGAFLAENYKAPEVVIGHSLGGAAVIRAAKSMPSVRAVATIGAPFDPEHVTHLLGEDIETIERNGIGSVNIGGRPFTIQKQFLDDLKTQSCEVEINKLKRALLILHSPQDRTVAIENAAKIYHAAVHPKSFVSLDGADHLLTRKEDSVYVGEVISSWAKRYIEIPEKEKLQSEKSVAVRLGNDGFTTDIMVRKHGLIADEPESIGGNDFGPSPYELVNAGLGACTAMTLHMYARRKKWDLQEVTVHLDHSKDYATDMENMEDPKSKIDHFNRVLEIKGNLDETQRARLLEIADKCPVHRTLHAPVVINTDLKE